MVAVSMMTDWGHVVLLRPYVYSLIKTVINPFEAEIRISQSNWVSTMAADALAMALDMQE